MHNIHFIDHRDTASFPAIIIDYLANDESLQQFISDFPSKESLYNAIQHKKQNYKNREILSKELQLQYEKLSPNKNSNIQLDLLTQEHTFTICTAHQPNILTGPLYSIYKAIHTIVLARQCKEWFSAYDFVPVFYIGSEDNDLEELNHFYWNEDRINWDTDQKGAVGRMQLDNFEKIIKQISVYFNLKIPHQKALLNVINSAYNKENSVANAYQILLHFLLADHGLLIINPDSKSLKSTMESIFLDEVLNRDNYKLVDEYSNRLNKKYKIQAYPRELNLFYIYDDIRNRIELENDIYKVVNTDIKFTKEEIVKEIELYPERFSPNVILRPLYQEMILPNIATIGGGAEVSYWMQLKGVFEKYNIPFPILILRQSVVWLPEKVTKLLDKTNLTYKDIWKDSQSIINLKIEEKYRSILNFKEVDEAANLLYERMISKAIASDATLVHSVDAIKTKFFKQMIAYKKKIKKSLKRRELILEERLEKIKKVTHPKGILQERIHNFIPYYLELGEEFIDVLLKNTTAFGNQVLLIASSDNPNEDK